MMYLSNRHKKIIMFERKHKVFLLKVAWLVNAKKSEGLLILKCKPINT